ncbi:MAG: Gfo/Idh/MocA family oxidoreductase [Anaerolineae bacterium]|nr:Gfo/Idh/MocA family oxidoreductase [Anaerolineae bacterium]
MDKVKVAVIGIGNIGNMHLRLIDMIPELELTAVCDIVPEKADAAAEQYGVKAYYDTNKLFADKIVDAVTVGTPHYGHTTIGIAAMNSGHHVLVEKPISVHKADCERLIAAHKANPDLVFAAMFNQRTDPYYKKIKEMVDSGELGKFVRINWIITTWFRTQAYYDSGGWRATWGGEGGGVLLNQCPHNLDLLQWICGMPDKVHGFCGIGKRHTIEVEDEVTAYMEYPGGCTGLFVTTTGEAPGTNRFEIVGDNGKLVYENDELVFTRNEVPATEFLRTCEKSFAQPGTSVETYTFDNHGGQHGEILKNYADAILTGAPLIAPAEEGINSVVLANSMLYSSLTGQPIEMPLDGKAYEAKLNELIATSTFVKETKEQTETDMGQSFN